MQADQFRTDGRRDFGSTNLGDEIAPLIVEANTRNFKEEVRLQPVWISLWSNRRTYSARPEDCAYKVHCPRTCTQVRGTNPRSTARRDCDVDHTGADRSLANPLSGVYQEQLALDHFSGIAV
jgi:hypothetical protein